jgi:hypothetical protein
VHGVCLAALHQKRGQARERAFVGRLHARRAARCRSLALCNGNHAAHLLLQQEALLLHVPPQHSQPLQLLPRHAHHRAPARTAPRQRASSSGARERRRRRRRRRQQQHRATLAAYSCSSSILGSRRLPVAVASPAHQRLLRPLLCCWCA